MVEREKPLVGIIMGSDSDLPTMMEAAEVLESFSIPWEMGIKSAHRTPDNMIQYARSAEDRGLMVIIAGAGGAAHLPGMIASETILPVIGVPIKTSTLSGIDSLYSIVQMPSGIVVATVGIGRADNAALLTAQIIARTNRKVREKLIAFRISQTEAIVDKDQRLTELTKDRGITGIQDYLRNDK